MIRSALFAVIAALALAPYPLAAQTVDPALAALAASPDRSLANSARDFNDEILTLGAGYWVGLVQQELA